MMKTKSTMSWVTQDLGFNGLGTRKERQIHVSGRCCCRVRSALLCLPEVGYRDGLIPGRALLKPQEPGQTFRDELLWVDGRQVRPWFQPVVGLNEVNAVHMSEGAMPSKSRPRTTSTDVGP